MQEVGKRGLYYKIVLFGVGSVVAVPFRFANRHPTWALILPPAGDFFWPSPKRSLQEKGVAEKVLSEYSMPI